MRWLLILVLALAACGGSSTAPPPNPPPNPLFVSTSGRDTNFGDVDTPLRTISKAAAIALDGYQIIVAPGTYAEGITTDRTGTPAQSVSLFADVSGSFTDNPPGDVVIDVTGLGKAGITLSNSASSTVDGFTITGSTVAGIVVKAGSNDATVRNCIVRNNPGDGIRVQDSSNVTVFNNLVYLNTGTGILIAGEVSGSPDAQAINNTVTLNVTRGITVGTTKEASPSAFLRNNIIANNSTASALQIRVITSPRSDVGFDGDFDLVFPGNYDPTAIRGGHDIGNDPSFVNSDAADFHLDASSPAIDAGDDAIDAGLVTDLRLRSTTGQGPDSPPIDIGYHFPS